MREIVFNHDNLEEKDIDEVVIRTKGLIINNRNEITLGYSHKTYQFPGGHLEYGESLDECLKREIKEESGIELDNGKFTPFVKIIYYTKNYRDSGKNRKNEIYYYVIKTNKVFNMDKANLDEWEQQGNYTIKVIPLKDVKKVLTDSIPDNPMNKIIVEEMLTVLDEYERTL